MIQILIILAIVFVLALAFSWLAENPGTVTVEWGFIGQQIEVGLVTALALLAALIATVMLTWWIVKGITRAPATLIDHRRGRARDKGYAALTQGMLALGAGDIDQARAAARQANKRLGHSREPMVLLLEAQTAIAEGRDNDARTLFDEMLEDPNTRPLGLRGLFLEAQREGEHEAARHYAERAMALSPKHSWATDAVLEYATLDGDYDRALSIVDDQLRAKTIAKAAADRKRTVILSARALSEVDSNPEAAREHARKAHKLAPDFVPAAIADARAHIRLGETRKALKAIEETWKREPHPDLADIYMHAQSGETTADRLKRARALAKAKPDHVESLLAVAHAALDANELDVAREQCQEAIKKDPREGAFLLMADIEEEQTGNAARVRHWLQMALRAPRDPAWVADGVVAREWAPVSPVSGRFDAFEWKRPARELGGPSIDVDNALNALPGPSDSDGSDTSSPPRLEVEDAEVVETDEDRANRIARDRDRGNMTAIDGSGTGTAKGRGDGVTIVTASSTETVGGSNGGAAPTGGDPDAAERARRFQGMGADRYAMAATTPPGAGGAGAQSVGEPRQPQARREDNVGGSDGLASGVIRRDPTREVRGVDLRARTVTRRPVDDAQGLAATSATTGQGVELDQRAAHPERRTTERPNRSAEEGVHAAPITSSASSSPTPGAGSNGTGSRDTAIAPQRPAGPTSPQDTGEKRFRIS